MNGKRSSPDSPRHYDAGSSSTSSSTFAPLDGAAAAALVVPDPASPSSLSPQSHSSSSIAGAQPPRKTRRTHARRSCLACRSRKARCELPDLNVPSSHDGLPTHLKCHRCRTLGTDCVVWDGDRKAKEGKAPRYGPPARAAVSQEQGKSTSEESGAHTATSRDEDSSMDNRADVTPPKPPRRGPRSSASASATAARRLIVTPAEVADTLSWDAEQAKRLHAQQHTASSATTSSSSRLPPTSSSSSSSSHPLKAAGLATSAPSTSSPSPPPGGSTSCSSHPQPAGEDIRSFDYRKKLANAMDRNGAQVCEIIYKSPLYAARSTKYTSTASSHVPPTGPNPSLDAHRLAAFVYANPFLDDEVLLSRGATSKRSAPPLPAATLYLKQVTAYICERPHHELTLLGALIQRTLCHVMFQTRSRDVCQALLLMATYEPLDLILPRPSEDLDETVDHAPGNCLYLAAMNIALSLGLDGCIWKMCSGPKALNSSSPMEERLDRLREAALWLALSNFGVLCAWSSVNPNLPSPAPSLVDIEAFQTNIGPLARSEKYRHLAKPLTALALRSKFFHRIRTFWGELRALEVSDISDIDPAMRLVGGMVEDVRAMDDWEVSAGDVVPNGFKGRAAPAPAQAEEEAVNTRMAPVLAWNRLERLDNVASLCTRLIFIFISVINAKTASASASAPSTGSSTSAANGAGATVKASMSSSSSSSKAVPSHADPQTSRLSMFEGWTASSHQTRAAAGVLWAYIQESCEAILEDAGRFVPSHLPPHHQHDKQAAADGTRPPVVSFPLHIISPIGLSSCIFGAAKMLVGHSAAINFGYGQLHHNVDHQVGIMRRAIETLSRFDRGDSLSLPALMVRICEELVVRYEALIRAGKRRDGARRASDAQEGDQPMSVEEAAAARASRSNSFSNSLHLRDGAGAAASVPSPHESTESTLRNWDVGMGRGRPSSGVGLNSEAGPAGRRPQYSPQSLRTPTGMATSSPSFSRLPSPATGTPTGSSWPGHHQLGLGLQQQPPTSLPSYGAVHQQFSPPASSSSTSSPFGPHGQPPTLPRPASLGSRGAMPAPPQTGAPYHSTHGPNGFAANQFSASSASPQPSAGPPSTSSSSSTSAHLPPPPQPFLAPGNGVQQQQHGYGSAAGSSYPPSSAQLQQQPPQQLNASSYSNTVLPPASTTAGADGLPFSEYDAALGNLFNQDLGDLISMDLTMLLGQGAGDGISSTGEEGQGQTVESHDDIQPIGGSAQSQGDVMMQGYSQPTVTSGPASVAPPPPQQQQQQQGQRASQPPPPPHQQQQQAQPPYYHPHYSTPPPPPPSSSSSSGFAPQQHFQHHHHLPPLGFQHAHGHGPSPGQGYGGPLPPPSSMASYQQQQHAQHHQGQQHGHPHHQPYAQHQQHQHQHSGQQQGHHQLPHLRPYR